MHAIKNHNGDDILIILEDDVILPDIFSNVPTLIGSIDLKADWDIIFLSYLPDFLDSRHIMLMYQLMKKINDMPPGNFLMHEARNFYKWGTHCYAVNPNSIEKLTLLMQEHSHSDGIIPLDFTYTKLYDNNSIKVNVIMPFLAGVNINVNSTISLDGRRVNPDEKYFPLVCNSYVYDYDIQEILDILSISSATNRIDGINKIVSESIYRRISE
jgi:hypothetical protein